MSGANMNEANLLEIDDDSLLALHALHDGTLDDPAAERLLKRMNANPAFASTLASWHQQHLLLYRCSKQRGYLSQHIQQLVQKRRPSQRLRLIKGIKQRQRRAAPTRSYSRTFAYVATAAALVLGVILFQTAYSPDDTITPQTVQHIEAPHLGTWELPGKEAMPVIANTHLSGPGLLTTTDGSRIDLHANSQAHMLPASEHGILLTAGKVAVEASPQDPTRPLRIRTSHGEARVLGTRFTVHTDSASTQVAVQHGRVAIVPADTETITEIGPGESNTFTATKHANVTTYSPDNQAQWHSFTHGGSKFNDSDWQVDLNHHDHRYWHGDALWYRAPINPKRGASLSAKLRLPPQTTDEFQKYMISLCFTPNYHSSDSKTYQPDFYYRLDIQNDVIAMRYKNSEQNIRPLKHVPLEMVRKNNQEWLDLRIDIIDGILYGYVNDHLIGSIDNIPDIKLWVGLRTAYLPQENNTSTWTGIWRNIGGISHYDRTFHKKTTGPLEKRKPHWAIRMSFRSSLIPGFRLALISPCHPSHILSGRSISVFHIPPWFAVDIFSDRIAFTF